MTKWTLFAIVSTATLANAAVEVRVVFGQGDQTGVVWDGSVTASGARITGIAPWRFEGADAILSNNAWKASIHLVRRFGGRGPFLCGTFSLADAFYAPVAFRFRTYGVTPAEAAGVYLEALLAHPFLRQWEEAALKETAIIDADEPRIIYREKLAAKGGAAA